MFQRFRKPNFKETFWFCFHFVHCETGVFSVMINNILNNEVGKRTGEHCVDE